MTAEIIDFDTAIMRLKGPRFAQVFKNHRNLRMMHLIIDGSYVARAKPSGPMTSA